MAKNSKSLSWVKSTDPAVLKRMFPDKLKMSYARPTMLDVIAQQAIVVSKRSTCLWYEVGAIIFHGDIILSLGYNGAARGDVDPREAGCARVVDGKLMEGQGLCRGSHAELNAIGNLSAGTQSLQNLQMMVTLHPCNTCAKQIVNKGIKFVHYLWEYGREEHATNYLRRLGVRVEKYGSPLLDEWIERNDYHPIGARQKQSVEEGAQ
ncbi:MAG: cytidine deaminase [Candidatus Pacebacteria bacterium]|nr:cytidine deaminase [Candidatus Paceibacterota bacterium]